MKDYVPCLICGHPVEREAQEASPFVREFQASKAAEVNGDQREEGASAQPAGAAAAPTGIPAGGQFASGGPPAGLAGACNWCGSTEDTIPVINGAGGWGCRRRCMFPVLGPTWAPREIPWRLVEPHRHQAMVNYRRTLEEIAERGGLDPIELVAVLEDRPGRWMGQTEAVDRLLEIIGQGAAPGAP